MWWEADAATNNKLISICRGHHSRNLTYNVCKYIFKWLAQYILESSILVAVVTRSANKVCERVIRRKQFEMFLKTER